MFFAENRHSGIGYHIEFFHWKNRKEHK